MPIVLPSYCLKGLKVQPVDVEIDLSPGLPHFAIIGMAGASIKESVDRIRSALKSSGLTFPMQRKTVNLAPAEVSKRGTHFELCIAVGLLLASGQIKEIPHGVMLIGELGLEGTVKGVKGILPALLYARDRGFKEVICPQENALEAGLVDGLRVLPVQNLREVLSYLDGKIDLDVAKRADLVEQASAWDFADIQGHRAAKRALMLAAAGEHHLLMQGPPGCGKSMLARAFSSILPPLSSKELLEVMQLYSVASHELGHESISRPFRSVQHHATPCSLIGGGVRLQPGEVSLAHRGVLFLDELPEFSRRSIEVMREPIEMGEVHLKRGHQSSTYPSSFQLIAAMNPCPCGFFGDPSATCQCHPGQVKRYRTKISGPILDRIDIQITVPRLSYQALNEADELSSKVMREQVLMARERQRVRWDGEDFDTNRGMTAKLVRSEPLDDATKKLIEQAQGLHHLSARGVYKLVKLARTLADLEGKDLIAKSHMMEALHYRVG
jgi:magnesium chelatase family protein